jgi:predicted nuclease of restriction endonuclease-like (RecB) superfamily
MASKKPKSTAVAQPDFADLLAEITGRIQAAQTRAVLAVNAELVRLYWDIGRIIQDRQKRAGWGAAVIPRLARELHNELPDLKGFSERNIKLMVQLASEYPHAFSTPDSIGQPPVAQLPSGPEGQLPVARIPWAHNVLLMQKVKDLAARRWYMEQTLANGWSRNLLALQIDLRRPAVLAPAAARLPRHRSEEGEVQARVRGQTQLLLQRRQRPPQASDRRPNDRPDPLPDVRPDAGRVQLRRHRQADRHLDLRTNPRAAGEVAVGPADGRRDRGRAGAEAEEAMKRLVTMLREQQAQADKLDTAINANLEEIGYGE